MDCTITEGRLEDHIFISATQFECHSTQFNATHATQRRCGLRTHLLQLYLIHLMAIIQLREIFKNEDRDFLHPGTQRGGEGSERGKKGHEGFLKKCFFSKTI